MRGLTAFTCAAPSPSFVQRARPVGFEQHVRLRRELEQDIGRLRPLEVEHQAAFVAVERDEADAFAVADRRRRPRHVAFRRLDLDDVGAHVGEQVPHSGPAMKLASSITLMPASGFAIDVSLARDLEKAAATISTGGGRTQRVGRSLFALDQYRPARFH